MERNMRNALVLLAVLFLSAGLFAQETKTTEAKWHGHIVRINQDNSTMDVRGGQKSTDSTEKRIAYDSSTKWTKLGKPADQKEFTQGQYVIVAGTVDDKGIMHATQVDLRQR